LETVNGSHFTQPLHDAKEEGNEAMVAFGEDARRPDIAKTNACSLSKRVLRILHVSALHVVASAKGE
jgi:hypothetical protein